MVVCCCLLIGKQHRYLSVSNSLLHQGEQFISDEGPVGVQEGNALGFIDICYNLPQKETHPQTDIVEHINEHLQTIQFIYLQVEQVAN